MLTPQEVAEHGFSKAHLGGYNMKEVDDFLDALTEDFSQLYKENVILKGKIKVLAGKISEYRETEEAMRTTLLSAQKMAKSMVAQAEEVKKNKLAEVENDTIQRKQELDQEIAEAETKLEAAKESTQQFVDGVRKLVQQEADFLDRLPELKLTHKESTIGQLVEATAEPETPATEKIAEEEPPEKTFVGDSIDQILREEEEEEPCSIQPEEEPEPVAVGAGVAPLDESIVDSTSDCRIDFDNLKFGKDYEIK